MAGKIILHRVYDEPLPRSGARFLVDRLWPRGKRKDALALDAWLKDAAPSTALRKWFAHDLEKWPEFKKRYWAELDQNAEALAPIRSALKKKNVVLLYGAKNEKHNQAVALTEYLRRKTRKK